MSRPKYAVILPLTAQVYAESSGQNLCDEAASVLAEDVSYRLRDVTQIACEFMRNSRRRKLTVDDFNRAFKWKRLEPLHGFGCGQAQSFRQVQNKGEAVYFYDDKEVNLKEKVFEMKNPQLLVPPSVRVHWLAVSGRNTVQVKKEAPFNETDDMSQLDETMREYYTVLCRGAISSEDQVQQTALKELKTGSHVAHILPHFINFIITTLPVFLQGETESIEGLHCLLKAIRALALNRHLYLVPHLPDLVAMSMKCVTDPSMQSSSTSLLDHWTLRSTGASITAQLVRLTGTVDSDIERQVLSNYVQFLDPETNPLVTLYGAMAGILAFGHKATEKYLLPYLTPIQDEVETQTNSEEEGINVAMLKGIIQQSVGKLLRRHKNAKSTGVASWKRDVVRRLTDDDEFNVESERSSFRQVYDSVYALCGDSFMPYLEEEDRSVDHAMVDSEWSDGDEDGSNDTESDSDDNVPLPQSVQIGTGSATISREGGPGHSRDSASVEPEVATAKPVKFTVKMKRECRKLRVSLFLDSNDLDLCS
eukprot:m.52864 g.52864  ORF g.52864 m.52864 type:complete len:534 (+) comp34236_c0_seq12:25-1626(+)